MYVDVVHMYVLQYVSTDGDKAIEHGRQKAGLDRGPNSDELLDGMHPSDCLCAILDVQKKRDWASAPQTAPTRQNVIVGRFARV